MGSSQGQKISDSGSQHTPRKIFLEREAGTPAILFLAPSVPKPGGPAILDLVFFRFRNFVS